MSENPLIKQSSLENIAKHCEKLCSLQENKKQNYILDACFQSKSQGIDECMCLIDSMLNADMKHLSKSERNILLQTLNNLRLSFAHQRELIIKKYDK